jgi:uncharacterized protein (DUF3820 family)
MKNPINKELTDNSPMPWGKFKGTAMVNVPATYLLWLYNEKKCDNQVKEYIIDNMDIILLQCKK